MKDSSLKKGESSILPSWITNCRHPNRSRKSFPSRLRFRFPSDLSVPKASANWRWAAFFSPLAKPFLMAFRQPLLVWRFFRRGYGSDFEATDLTSWGGLFGGGKGQ